MSKSNSVASLKSNIKVFDFFKQYSTILTVLKKSKLQCSYKICSKTAQAINVSKDKPPSGRE
jgi:hypothetical protein